LRWIEWLIDDWLIPWFRGEEAQAGGYTRAGKYSRGDKIILV